jgi:hypothetical protein
MSSLPHRPSGKDLYSFKGLKKEEDKFTPSLPIGLLGLQSIFDG